MSKIGRNIKISEKTYEALVRVKGYLEMQKGRKYTFDEVIAEALKNMKLDVDFYIIKPSQKS
jgi:predicted CopG family antitoxin